MNNSLHTSTENDMLIVEMLTSYMNAEKRVKIVNMNAEKRVKIVNMYAEKGLK